MLRPARAVCLEHSIGVFTNQNGAQGGTNFSVFHKSGLLRCSALFWLVVSFVSGAEQSVSLSPTCGLGSHGASGATNPSGLFGGLEKGDLLIVGIAGSRW